MSGIAALFHPQGSSIDENLMTEMAFLMARRGPEKQQYWLNDNVALAHCLLPTTLEAINEQQPSNLDDKLWITADARIDARDELIKKLITQRCDLSSASTDDQLILHAYSIWGIDCLQHIIGDFAFVLWDFDHQRLFCATDHFGVSPLYYAETSKGLCISNTLNAIRLHPEVSDELDEPVIGDYLLFRINEGCHRTTFKQIKHLPAGHCLVFEDNSLKIHQYWSLAPRTELYYTTQNTYIEEFSELLQRAVADRTRTSSIGVHLSGGMDSSSITSITHKIMHDRGLAEHMHAYTFGSSGTLPDLEGPLAREVANLHGIEHHIFSQADRGLEYHESPPELRFPEPRFTSRKTSAYKIFEHVSTYSTVLLSGFGGDPLLRGDGLAWTDLNTPNKFCYALKHIRQHYQLFGKRPPLGLRRKVNRLSLIHNHATYPEWIQKDFAMRNNLEEHIKFIQLKRLSTTNFHSGMQTAGLWRRLFCLNDPGFTHIPVKLLHPFFDVRLLEFAHRLPPFPWLHDKTILRQSMQHRLPASIIQRPKTPLPGNGFGSMLKQHGVPDYFYSLLNTPEIQQYVNVNAFYKKLNCLEQCKKEDFKAILRVLTLAHWLRGYQQTPFISTTNRNANNVQRIKTSH
jgi:asparagine synthase (glutamine-hydrolysing)